MSQYTNKTGVPLSVAVFLASDYYAYDPEAISATALIRPLRQTILRSRVPPEDQQVDVLDVFKSRLGTALHDSIEHAWKNNYGAALKILGFPDKLIERVVINPDPGTVTSEQIPVYMEQRHSRIIDGIKVSGKYDFVADGRLEDFKSTSTFTYGKDSKDEDYQLQGSIYRWLTPEIITQDHMAIQFLFTDWKAGLTKTKNYPPRPTEERLIPLLSLDDTEDYIRDRIQQFRRLQKAPEETLPKCSDKDLWRGETVYKYYKNPAKMARATANFDTQAEAQKRLIDDGGVGVILTVPGEVKACHYCDAFSVCSQKDALIQEGSLVIH